MRAMTWGQLRSLAVTQRRHEREIADGVVLWACPASSVKDGVTGGGP
jgi:hypothetical protein